jgi:TonB-dependent receptor
MKLFKPNLITVAFLISGLTAVNSYANEADIKNKTKESVQELQELSESDETEVIEIRGFQRSIIESINIKRFSDTMVDAITADDLGALPDLSIADSLSRLPGVTAIRNGGQSSELNIRGLSGQYVFSTLNGREQVSSSGGRTVEFSQFPSELINTALVHKSQKASLIEGGVAGTIDLKTINPLDYAGDKKFHVNAQLTNNSRASDHPDADAVGHRFSFSYKDKFLDDTLGVAVGVARLFQPSVSTQFVGYNFNYDQVRYDGIQGLSDCGNAETDTEWRENQCLAHADGFEIMSRGGEDERNGIMSALVWQPNEQLTVKGDVFYSKFDSQAWDRGLSVNGLNTINSTDHLRSVELTNPVVAGNDDIGYSLIGGTYHAALNNPFSIYDENSPCTITTAGKVQAPCIDANGQRGVNPLRISNIADEATRHSEVLTLGFNTTWQSDDLTLSLDLSHSKASEQSLDRSLSIVMFDDAAAHTPKIETDVILSYQMNGLTVPNVSFTNAANEDIDFTNLNKMMVNSYSQFPRYEENQADAVSLDLTYELDNDYISSVEAGVRASKRTHIIERSVWSYGGPGHTDDIGWDQMREGNYINYASGVETVRYQPYQLSADEVEVVHLGGEFSSLPSFLAIDNDAIIDKWAVDENGQAIERGAVDVWEGADWTITDDSNITEKVNAIYLMANLDTTFFDMPLRGNIGVRVIETEQQASGVTPAPTSRQFKIGADGEPLLDKDGQQVLETVETGDAITDDVGETRRSHLYRDISHKFTNVLPSLNLNLSVTDTDYIKFAVARVLARPDLSQMAVSGNFNYEMNRSRDGKDVVNVDMATSPFLEPFLANQVDLSFEHYFTETDGNIFLALYYKDIESFTDTTTVFDFDFAGAGIQLPTTSDNGQPVESGDLTITVNNEKGGYVRGYEIGYTQTFKFLPGAWSGLGISGSYSHTESEIRRTVNIGNGQGEVDTPIEGLSPSIYSFTLFYNYDDIIDTYLNVRHREGYLGRQVAVGQDQSAYFTDETIIDYQIKYNMTENVNVTLSINNLTDEANRSYFGDKTKTGTLQYFGRNYFMGVNYTF